jgi:hypothetical protein
VSPARTILASRAWAAGKASSGSNAAPCGSRLYLRGGRVILHHGHIRPVLIRDWSSKMDGITSTIWASQTTLPLGPRDRLYLARLRCV